MWNTYLHIYPELGGGMFYIWGISDWSGQNLDTVGTLILYFLAQATGDVDARKVIDDGWANGMKGNRKTQTLFPVAAFALGQPGPEFADVLDEATWNMREVEYPKQSFAIDRTIDPTWCASPLPSLPWKLDWMDGQRNQGLYGVPMWERIHTNVWICAPSDFQTGRTDWTDGGGADFLHAYWLGRAYGVFGTED